MNHVTSYINSICVRAPSGLGVGRGGGVGGGNLPPTKKVTCVESRIKRHIHVKWTTKRAELCTNVACLLKKVSSLINFVVFPKDVYALCMYPFFFGSILFIHSSSAKGTFGEPVYIVSPPLEGYTNAKACETLRTHSSAQNLTLESKALALSHM